MVDFPARPCFDLTPFAISNGAESATTVSFARGVEDEDHRVHETELRRSRLGRGFSSARAGGGRDRRKAGEDRQSGVRVQFFAARYPGAPRPVRDYAGRSEEGARNRGLRSLQPREIFAPARKGKSETG